MNSIDELHAATDQWQQGGTIQPLPALLGHVEPFKRHKQSFRSHDCSLGQRSRKRTVTNADSITLVVRRCFQCSAGNSKKLINRSQLAVSDSTALGYLGLILSRKTHPGGLAI